MSFEFAQLDTRVVTLGALVRLLERVSVAYVAHQFTGSGEGGVALLALLRPHAGVRVDVVLQRRDRLEAAIADRAFVRAFLRTKHKMCA